MEAHALIARMTDGYFEIYVATLTCLQCFDAVGWVAGRASGL